MIACRGIVLLAPVLLSSIALGQADPLEHGLQLFRQEKYEAALQQFKNAARAEPANASIENFIGITETKLGRIEQANTDYEAAIRLDSRLADAHKNLAFNYLASGKYELAEKQLKTALSLNGNDPFVHYYLVILYLSTSRDQDAIAHIGPARSLFDNDPQTAFLAAKACLRSNASAEGLRLIDSLEQRSALSLAQEYELAKLLDEKQMYTGSVQRFRRIAEMQPSSWENQYNLAIALIKAKQPNQAFPLLASLTEEHSNDGHILAMLASAYESANNSDLALRAYRKAITADPQNPDRYLDCSRLLMDLNRYDDAEDVVQQGILKVADDYPLTVRLGAVEVMKGNRDQAREHFRKAIAEHPEIALGYVALAQSYMKEGNEEEALKVLVEGRAKVPRDFALEYVFGLVSYHLGQQSQAMQALKNAEELAPNVAEPHYQLGVLYMQMQQWKTAQAEFERVLQIDPHRAVAYYQLSRAYTRTGDIKKAHEMAAEAKQFEQTQQEDAISAEKLRLGAHQQ